MEELNFADGYLAGFDCPLKVWYILARSRKLVPVESLYEIISTRRVLQITTSAAATTRARTRQPGSLLLNSRTR